MSTEVIPYMGICAPRRKRGTLIEGLSEFFQCDDAQNINTHQERFGRGAECIRRRIDEMALHGTNTPNNRDARKRHLIPVKLTYTFAKDCLRRYAPDSEVRAFERDINGRMARMLGYSRYSIENTIRRGANNSRTLRRVKNLLSPLRNSNNSSNSAVANSAVNRPQRRHIFVSNSRHTRRRTRSNMRVTLNANNMMRTVSYKPYMSPKPE